MLEPMYGSDAINQLVGQMLLEQAIEEYEIDIDGLVEDEINGITEELGGEYYLGYFLQQNGITEAELRENMRVELALKEIAIKDVVVSDDEVEEYSRVTRFRVRCPGEDTGKPHTRRQQRLCSRYKDSDR